MLDFGNVTAQRSNIIIVEVEFPAAGKTLKWLGRGSSPEKNAVGGQALKIMLPDKPDSKLEAFAREWSESGDYDVRKKAGLE